MSLAFFPKSLQNKFGFCLGSQRQLPKRDNTLYLWPRSKGWMRAVKRTFNLQRLKSQIQGIGSLWKRLLCCANQDLSSYFYSLFISSHESYFTEYQLFFFINNRWVVFVFHSGKIYMFYMIIFLKFHATDTDGSLFLSCDFF